VSTDWPKLEKAFFVPISLLTTKWPTADLQQVQVVISSFRKYDMDEPSHYVNPNVD